MHCPALRAVRSTVNRPAAGEITGIDATAVSARQDAAIAAVVVSVDGQTENIVDLVLNLPSHDTSAVLAEVNDITGDADFAKKKDA